MYIELLCEWVIFEDFSFVLMQIYVWVGCNTAKFGHLYAAATTRPVSRNCFILGGLSLIILFLSVLSVVPHEN